MRLLLDANLSPLSVELLADAGYDAAHVRDFGLLHADDEPILDFAASEVWVVVTEDEDFPALLAHRRASEPSVVHLRGVEELSVHDRVALLVANLPTIVDALEAGAVVSLSPTLAVRSLPIA